MITSGFTYAAFLIFFAGFWVFLGHKTKAKFFEYVPPVVIIYLTCMLLCTLGTWDMKSTSSAYGSLKNNLLFGMVFLMLLRCDIRKVLKLGPKMLIGFFSATFSIMFGFIVAYAIFHSMMAPGSWKALGALTGSWIGGTGNMIAIQAALDVKEADMAYAILVDSVDYSIWVMFLLWAVGLAAKFNAWTKADTKILDEVSRNIEEKDASNKETITFPSLIIMLGLGLIVSAIGQDLGAIVNKALPLLDKATWTVLIVTALGLLAAVTPLANIKGGNELSNVMLYTVVALISSRASLLEVKDAPVWIIAGFVILGIHGALMLIIAKTLKLDMFTCGVASLANIGGAASAPILAASYSGSLVPVAILMALMGYAVGTPLGLVTARIMSIFG
jgi:uncharacterized membrane protein